MKAASFTYYQLVMEYQEEHKAWTLLVHLILFNIYNLNMGVNSHKVNGMIFDFEAKYFRVNLLGPI